MTTTCGCAFCESRKNTQCLLGSDARITQVLHGNRYHLAKRIGIPERSQAVADAHNGPVRLNREILATMDGMGPTVFHPSPYAPYRGDSCQVIRFLQIACGTREAKSRHTTRSDITATVGQARPTNRPASPGGSLCRKSTGAIQADRRIGASYANTTNRLPSKGWHRGKSARKHKHRRRFLPYARLLPADYLFSVSFLPLVAFLTAR